MFSGGPYFLSEYARMRQQEMVQLAEQHRLVSQAIQKQEHACVQQYRLHQKALLKLGEHLVSWGTNLQIRYIHENEAPTVATYQEGGAFGK